MCHFTYIRITFKKDRIGLLMEGSHVGEKVVFIYLMLMFTMTLVSLYYYETH